MAARMRYPEVAPEGYAALSAFGHYVNTGTALEPVLLGLVYLRASVLNGCAFCIELHKAELRKHHEPETRIDAVSEGPGSDSFTPREQAALRWTEVLTQLHGGPAPDEEYAAIASFFQGKDLVDLCYAIANINAWNRMGIAFRPQWHGRTESPTAAGQTTTPVLPPPAVTAQAASAATQQGVPVSTDGDDDEGKVSTD